MQGKLALNGSLKFMNPAVEIRERWFCTSSTHFPVKWLLSHESTQLSQLVLARRAVAFCFGPWNSLLQLYFKSRLQCTRQCTRKPCISGPIMIDSNSSGHFNDDNKTPNRLSQLFIFGSGHPRLSCVLVKNLSSPAPCPRLPPPTGSITHSSKKTFALFSPCTLYMFWAPST